MKSKSTNVKILIIDIRRLFNIHHQINNIKTAPVFTRKIVFLQI